jgi:4-hydroxy-tetrahydrodipicolinate synthase
MRRNRGSNTAPGPHFSSLSTAIHRSQFVIGDLMQDLSGIWIPLVTPFAPDGAVDHAGLGRLVEMLAAAGIAGFVACGSTGEAAMLDEAEQHDVLRTVLAHAGGRNVVFGVSGIRPEAVCRRLAPLEGLPLAGVLVSSPSYVKPSQAGLRDFFTAVADASPCPVLLYDIPARTGVRIATDTMLALAAHPNIVGVKDCSDDIDHAQAIIDDGRLQLLAGNDYRVFTALCQGAAGAVTASAHLCPERFVALHAAIARGELPAARALWRGLRPLTHVLFEEPNPAPVKAALAERLDLGDGLRAPMTRASEAQRARTRAVLAALEAAGEQWH